jgi:hypothetical protein
VQIPPFPAAFLRPILGPNVSSRNGEQSTHLTRRYAIFYETADHLRAIPKPTKAHAAAFRKLPQHLRVQERFFSELGPGWLLRLKSSFAASPRPRENVDGQLSYATGWPAYRYLARMAALPEMEADVVSVLAGVEEPVNPYLLRDLADALACLRGAQGQPFAERLLVWVEHLESWPALLLDKLLEVANAFARDGDPHIAERVLGSALSLSPSGEPRRILAGEYERLLRSHLDTVAAIVGRDRVFRLLLNALEDALTAPNGFDADTATWRPAIEDHGQNAFDDSRNELVSAVRRFLEESLVNGVSTQRMIETLEARSPQLLIHKRFVLHALIVAPEAPPLAVESYLLDERVAKESETFHEYSLLLHKRFSALSVVTQKGLLALIHRGSRYSRRARLTLIALHLDPEERARYEELTAREGVPEHPDFQSFSKGSFGFVGYTSPVSIDALSLLTVEELHRMLESFEPSPNPFTGPSAEGVGKQLEELVAASPALFAEREDLLLFREPTFTRSVIDGFRTAVVAGKEIPWKPILALCAMVLGKPTNEDESKWPVGRDPGWTWAQVSVFQLIQAGLKSATARIPATLRTETWGIIRMLANVPLTRGVFEAERDLVFACINSLRGQALECVLDYAEWVISDGADGRSPRGPEGAPEIRAVLDENVQSRTQPAPTIHSFFGLNLWRLQSVDAVWTSQTLPLIFPSDIDLRRQWEAAWDAFVSYSGPIPSLFGLMRNDYARAVEARIRPTGERDNAPMSLAEHLMILFGGGTIAVDDALLIAFFRNASDPVRAHFIFSAGRAFARDEGSVPPAVIERFKSLGERRLDELERLGGTVSARDELRAFGWWFAAKAIPVQWSSSALARVATLRGGLSADYWVAERLSEVADDVPVQAAAILRGIAEGETDQGQLEFLADKFRAVLLAARDRPEDVPPGQIREIVSILASKGCIGLLDILPPGVKLETLS